MSRRAIMATIGVVIAAIVLIGGGYLLYRYLRPSYKLQAVYVTTEPKLDGQGNDAVWKNAPELTIPIDQAEPITIKAVYTKTKIFFLARYADSSQDAVFSPWVYDGKTWAHGRRGDALELFFDIGNSVVGFPDKGFKIMTYGFKPGLEIYNFGQINKGKSKKVWPGSRGRADVWLMGAGNGAAFGIGDDMIYQANQDYLFSPETSQAQVWPQWDQFTNLRAINLNSDTWREAIAASEGGEAKSVKQEQPYLMYTEGLNLNNTPYPFDDQLTPMTASATARAGDKLPFVYYARDTKGNWGGSRGDVKGTMKWLAGNWTVEMGRSLNTKNPDDIVFRTREVNNVHFGALVRRDGQTTRFSPPATLELVPQGGE